MYLGTGFGRVETDREQTNGPTRPRLHRSPDLGCVAITMARQPAPIERFGYILTDKGDGKGELRSEITLPPF